MDLLCCCDIVPRGDGVAPTEGVAVNSPILELREESRLPLGLVGEQNEFG